MHEMYERWNKKHQAQLGIDKEAELESDGLIFSHLSIMVYC